MAWKTGQCEEAYEGLRRQLIHCQVPPGQRLTETKWAEKLGVYRSALREAMALLAHEGLLIRGPRGGYFVLDLGPKDLRDIQQARAVIEAGAIRFLSAGDVDEKNLTSLDDLCESMRQMAESGFEMGVEEADRKFHESLVRLSGNQRLIELYSHAPLPFVPSDLADSEARRQVALHSANEHREIVRLIRERQFIQAIEMLERHLEICNEKKQEVLL